MVLSYGDSSLYQEGVLCYVRGTTIRVLKVHEAGNTELVIDIKKLLLQGTKKWSAYYPYIQKFAAARFAVEILQCQGGMLSMLIASRGTRASGGTRVSRGPGASSGTSYLIVVDIRTDLPKKEETQERVRLVIQGAWPGTLLEGSRPGIKIRHTSNLLYYISNQETSPHREWAIHFHKYALNSSVGMPAMICTWPGQSVVFKIHGGFLYILSNQSAVGAFLPFLDGFEPLEEDDGESYYQCYRFPVDNVETYPGPPRYNVPLLMEQIRVWRRQPQAEPSDNTSWADLTLHEDESTGKLVVVESRQHRGPESGAVSGTYEFQPLAFPERRMLDSTQPSCFIVGSSGDSVICPLHTLGKKDRPYDKPPHDHRRYDRANTKYRAYNLGCNAFLDVTFDERDDSISDSAGHSPQHVHFHIGSRTPASPLNKKTGLLHGFSPKNAKSLPFEASEKTFDDRGIKVWPPVNAPESLLQLLNPFHDCESDIHVESDERSVIYIVGLVKQEDGNSYLDKRKSVKNRRNENSAPKTEDTTCDTTREDHAIILVSFDSGIDYPGLRKMSFDPDEAEDPVIAITGQKAEGSLGPADKGKGKEKVALNQEVGREGQGSEEDWFRIERAMWMDIGKGFQFSY
ncbi:hypothetical protein MMC28_009071 [Mycoblastus sanguinarius]|nr:hypothetical protein [Mycoblastus sanguinarius]